MSTGPRRRTPIPDRQRARIAKMFRDDKLSIAIISERTGLGVNPIYRVLKEAGLYDPQKARQQ